MNRERLANLLHDVRAGRKPVDAAVRQFFIIALIAGGAGLYIALG